MTAVYHPNKRLSGISLSFEHQSDANLINQKPVAIFQK
jgi:hypothetical protein